LVKGSLRLRPEQIRVIPNGIDCAAFDAVKPADLSTFGLPAGVRPLVFVGRLEWQKGIDRLLPLFAGLPALESHLLIVGDGPERARCERTAQATARSRVHFAGWQANVPAILKSCHMLLLPSRYEGMPNVVLEAMAAGLPILATSAEGVHELLGAGAAEQVLPFDELLWTAAILTHAKNRDQGASLGVRNRQRATAEFSLDSMVENYERLFATLAK
jgi:glycosyltransferase involved in cell wall biosynthesis